MTTRQKEKIARHVNSARTGVKTFIENSKPTNPKDILGSNKLPLHLWPETATAVGSLAFMEGALKYGRSNWRVMGVKASIYVDAAKRHLNAWFEGEENSTFETDDGEIIDSGIPHLGNALACIAIIVDAKAAGLLVDDRQIKGGYNELIEKVTPLVKLLKERYKDKSPRHYTIKDSK